MSADDPKKNHTIVVSPQISHFSEFDTGEHDVFVVKEEGPDFRGVTCIGAAVLIAKSQFGLGVLGLPQTFSTLGFVPGLICLVALCAISTWTGYVVGKFRLRYPHIYSIGDAAEMMFGTVGREFMGGAFWLFYALCYGASVLTFSIALNTLSNHAICTTGFVGIGAAISLIIGTSVRTMKVMSWCGYVALGSIFLSTWIVVIACLSQSTPAAAPKGVPIDKDIVAVSSGKPFYAIASAIATQLLGLCGTASFFTIHSEMKDQTQYIKSLFLGQGFVVFNYMIVSCIIYGKVGDYVTSPALGSAGPLFQKICYGIALPGLIFSCFFQAHLAGKYGLVRILRGTEHLQTNSFTHWLTWISMMVIVIVFGFVIASAIPFFNDLLALIGAFIGTSFTLIVPGFLALYLMSRYMTKKGDGTLSWLRKCTRKWSRSRSSVITTVLALFAIVFGFFILVAGTYGAVQSIINGYKNGTVSKAFDCADNS
ncbi:hypothetical protein CJI97_001772 [Candidozyma auris]|nr:hypothetical protein CJI97_001772 [[Candida] auris]